MNKFKLLTGPMRLPFLVLTPACVLLGLGSAVWTSARVNPVQVVCIFIAAICAHISVNAFNEYFDFKSGLDFNTCRTPFSGGSGTLPARSDLTRMALTIAWTTFFISALIGLYFVHLRGPALLPLGLLGLFLLYAYTPWLTHNPILCLIAPGLGFGPLMVISTYFALTGQFSWTAFLASLVPFFLVSDLLLLNQFPDVEADQRVGRRHFPILVGRKRSSMIYSTFLLLAYLTIVIGVGVKILPPTSLIGLLGLGLAIPAGVIAYRHAEDISGLLPSMGLNVLVNIVTPTLLGIGLLIK
jgi:1,4-dihydroxy-2-naphthoate polyprenyltransferase